jgi:hypothetical protein
MYFSAAPEEAARLLDILLMTDLFSPVPFAAKRIAQKYP